jgi:hypothetical protein
VSVSEGYQGGCERASALLLKVGASFAYPCYLAALLLVMKEVQEGIGAVAEGRCVICLPLPGYFFYGPSFNYLVCFV